MSKDVPSISDVVGVYAPTKTGGVPSAVVALTRVAELATLAAVV